MKDLWGWLMREWNFVDRGYDVIKFPANLLQFVSIFMLAWLPEYSLESPVFSLALLGLGVVVLCSIAGHFDFGKRGTYPQRAIINRKCSPYDRDMAEALLYLIEDMSSIGQMNHLKSKLDYWSKPLGEETT